MGLDAAQLLEGAAEASVSGGALNDPLLPATLPGSLEWFPGGSYTNPTTIALCHLGGRHVSKAFESGGL